VVKKQNNLINNTLGILFLSLAVIGLFGFGGCKKSAGASGSAIVLDMGAATFKSSYAGSGETIEIKLRGEGVEKILTDSIRLSGDNSSAQPIQPLHALLRGDYVSAEFAGTEVNSVLSSTADGSTHTVVISFSTTDNSRLQEVSALVTISNDNNNSSSGNYTFSLDPSQWSLNYDRSNGTVEAFIEGDNLDRIDLNSITLSGDDSNAEALAASSVSINNDKIHARFPKSQLTALLLDPQEGSTHTVTLSFMVTGATTATQLTAEITIEEDDDENEGGGGEPANLSLDLAPDKWNLNFSNGGGNVNAFIRGDHLDGIDVSTLEMSGDYPAALPLQASSASLEGEHVKGKFAKNQVLDLLMNPQSGSTHIVTVTFKTTGGTQMHVSTQVTITGK